MITIDNKINILFILIITIIIYIYINNKNTIEKMSQTNPISQENLTAIRNLGQLAGKILSDDNITLPGNVIIKGKLDVNGFTQNLGGASVEGKLHFRHKGANGSDDTDPYHIEKIRTGPDRNSLRLTIEDNADESFQIWGQKTQRFRFGADGSLNFGEVRLRNNNNRLNLSRGVDIDGTLRIGRVHIADSDNRLNIHKNVVIHGDADILTLSSSTNESYVRYNIPGKWGRNWTGVDGANRNDCRPGSCLQ